MKQQIIYISAAILLSIGCSDQNNSNSGSSTEADANGRSFEKGQSQVVDSESEQNILNIAIGSPDHTTLVAAVQAAEMEDILVNAGPLTVFAPTNEAFAKLPEGTVADLLKPENKAKLAEIITYHAAPGSYDANNIKGVMGIGQANMQKVKVTEEDGSTFVNGAKVLGTVKASNGIVHVIDQVLIPAEEK
ncbi:MAG: fasciclin domain-containing protein [Bacteroidia bacterium]|nr:fasciclin domain-containing protein [Bacteroidia bacterium]